MWNIKAFHEMSATGHMFLSVVLGCHSSSLVTSSL